MHALTPALLRRPASRLQGLLRQPQRPRHLHGNGAGAAAAHAAQLLLVLLACCLPAIVQSAPLHGPRAPADATAGAPAEFIIAVRPVPLPAAATRLPAIAGARSGFAGALGDEQLAALRGGTETPWSDMRLNGTVANNAATNVVTGANIISEGAFSNASGLPMVIQNSGANVLIQNATIVNVQFQ